MQNEAGGTGGGLLNRFALKGVGIVPSVLRHAYHAWIGEIQARKMCMPFGAGKDCYVQAKGRGPVAKQWKEVIQNEKVYWHENH